MLSLLEILYLDWFIESKLTFRNLDRIHFFRFSFIIGVHFIKVGFTIGSLSSYTELHLFVAAIIIHYLILRLSGILAWGNLIIWIPSISGIRKCSRFLGQGKNRRVIC